MKSLLSKIGSLFNFITGQGETLSFLDIFISFQKILELNNRILELMAEMGDKLSGDYIFDKQYIKSACEKMSDLVYKLIYNLDTISPHKYSSLYDVFNKINSEIQQELEGKVIIPESDYTMPYDLIDRDFSDIVGGKNANLAEIRNFLNIRTPDGFAITTKAFQYYMDSNNLWEQIGPVYDKW